MTRDNKSKLIKETNKRNKRSDELSRRTKNNDNSDSNDSDWIESDSDMDSHEYRKFLSKLYPSKHLDKKIKAGEDLKKKIKGSLKNDKSENTNEDDSENYCSEEEPVKYNTRSKNRKLNAKKQNNKKNKAQSDSESDEKEVTKTCKSKNKCKNKNKSNNNKNKKNVTESESETESEVSLGSQDTYEEYDSDDSNSDSNVSDSDEENIKTKGNSKFNIIFTIGGVNDEDEDEWETDYSDYSSDSYYETENEDESVSSVSLSDTDSESEYEVKNNKKTKKDKKKNNKNNKNHENNKIKQIQNDVSQIENKIINNNENDVNNNGDEENKKLLNKLKELHENNTNNKTIQKCIDLCEKELKVEKEKKIKKEKKQKEKNSRIFSKIVRDKNTMNDFTFFNKLEIEQQKKIIKELKEINKITRIEKPYRMTLLEADIPINFKAAAIKKINTLRYMEPGSGEFYKIKNWVDTFMRIPFGNYRSLDISIDDGVEKCHDFMYNAQKTLDQAVYGLNDAKMQIMQLLGQLITNPKAIGTAIAIYGPPGSGKTSIFKEGISKILNRPFAFIALGGATDSSFLEGHSYTYEGSTWGKIVQILVDSKCMNPVIYFDELDKISDTPKGEEIAGILTHLTDTSQNNQFHDKYFAEIDFDLSKCIFIFSYNDESKVNPILKDRMYRIQTKGYNQKEKTIIAKDYLLPKIREQVKFKDEDIIISDESLHYIIDNLCNKEDGVRNLKRCLEIIYTKLNLYRLMKPGSNLFEENMSLKVEFPFVVTKDIIDKLIKSNTDKFAAWHTMYI